jgi:hypothetical protein
VETSSGEVDTQRARHAERGSHDGTGAGDHDVPYRFGRRPRADAPYPFSTRQFARLLIQRARFRLDEYRRDDRQSTDLLLFLPDGVWLASSTQLLSPRTPAIADG